MNHFKDRREAGKKLAELLRQYKNKKDVLILALPRGGVPVADEVAQALHVPMTVFLVRKLGIPGHEECAMGAIAESGVRILNQSLIRQLSISEDQLGQIIEKETHELARRLKRYRHNKALPHLHEKTIILIDDGIATGATAKVAIQALKNLTPKKIILATPIASRESLKELAAFVDETFCVLTPAPFYGVGQGYQHFDQTSDEEVLACLEKYTVALDKKEMTYHAS